MPLIRITNGFEKLTDPRLITRGGEIFTAMTGNVNFTTPVPSLTNISTAIAQFQQWFQPVKKCRHFSHINFYGH